jgi:hypothetical protein
MGQLFSKISQLIRKYLYRVVKITERWDIVSNLSILYPYCNIYWVIVFFPSAIHRHETNTSVGMISKSIWEQRLSQLPLFYFCLSFSFFLFKTIKNPKWTRQNMLKRCQIIVFCIFFSVFLLKFVVKTISTIF